MSNAWFFEKFELIADLPEAVSRMRELIFSLAVRGKLVSQTSSENASHKVDVHVASNEGDWASSLMDDTPQDWVIRRAEQIGRINPRNTAADNIVVGFAPMNVIPTELGQDLIAESRYWGEVKKGYTHFADGDVIVAKITPCFQNGKACVVSGLPSGIGAGTTELHVIRPHLDLADPKYLLICFKSPKFVEGGVKSFTGTAGQQRVSNEYFRNYPIPLPPLSEQHRIVAKVEELMGICDRLELEQRERESSQRVLIRSSLQRFSEEASVENLGYLFHGSYTVSPSDLRKTILTLAVQGKLVPQDPDEGSAEDLMNQIMAYKAKLASNGRLRGPTAVTPLSETQAEFDIPAKWCWVRFGEITVNRDGERIPVSKEERETKEKKYDYYGASGVIDKIDRYLFDTPLLLIGEDGANLINRSTPIAFIARGKYWVNNHAHVLDGISEDCLRYIELHINAISLEKYITGSAQPKMNQAKMNSIPIALPPLAEQRRIVAKVEELMSMVDELEVMEKQATDRGSSLLDAIVHELAAIAG